MYPCSKEIRTLRSHITPLRVEDCDAVQAITDVSVTSRIHFLPEPFTAEDARALILGHGDGQRFFGVRSPNNGARLFGVIGVHPKQSGEVEIGYWFAASARGKGLAAEAVDAMVMMLASRNPQSRIVAECSPDNRRSWALLERIGFRPAGQRGDRPGRMLLAWNARSNARFDVC